MYTSSSPLAVRGTSPAAGAGSSSFKRSVSARGTTASYPRPTAGSISSSLGTAAEQGVSVQDLRLHFSISCSGRRNVASSPTASYPTAAVPPQNPALVTVGFSAPVSDAISHGAASAQHQPAKRTGLLSRAFTLEDQASLPLPPVAEISSASLSGPSYFPDVDRTLLHDLQERHEVFHTELVSMAYMLAAKAYDGQLRKDGSTQLSHCVMTALQLADLGLDAESVAAGLLHEVLRMNPMFRSQLEEFLPTSVINLVDRVTTISEISQLYRTNRDALSEEKMRRMLLAMEDVRAMLVKLCCRVHNMKTLSALPRATQESMAQETLEIFSVVANRLGIWSLKAELEDAAFAVLHPDEYESLKAQLSRRQDPEVLEATINKISSALDAAGVQYEEISGRPKSLFGIWTKLRASGKGASLDRIYDVTALRVVVTNKHDCYRALRCVQETYRSMSERSKDYIKENKKPNGYQSLHETIYGEGNAPMEVQIRTHKMHYIAEYGFAAHWKYKEKLSDEDEWLNKEVQYKKWLTTYKLGVHDKKVRVSGAPPRETALQSLGMHLIDALPGSSTSTSAPAGVDPFLRHDRFRLEAPAQHRVNVLLQTQDTIETREFAKHVSVDDLACELRVDQLPGYVLTVNQRLPASGYALRTGDLIQVVPLSAVLSRSPPESNASSPAGSVRRGGGGFPRPLHVHVPSPDSPATDTRVFTPSSSLNTRTSRHLPPLSSTISEPHSHSSTASTPSRPPVHPVSSSYRSAFRRRSITDGTAVVPASVCV